MFRTGRPMFQAEGTASAKTSRAERRDQDGGAGEAGRRLRPPEASGGCPFRALLPLGSSPLPSGH